MPAETRRIPLGGEALYAEIDVTAGDLITAVRAYNDGDRPARVRLTVTSGPSAGRTTGWQTIPQNTGAPGAAVLTLAVPTGAAGNLQLDWDATRQRYTNLEKEFTTG